MYLEVSGGWITMTTCMLQKLKNSLTEEEGDEGEGEGEE